MEAGILNHDLRAILNQRPTSRPSDRQATIPDVAPENNQGTTALFGHEKQATLRPGAYFLHSRPERLVTLGEWRGVTRPVDC